MNVLITGNTTKKKFSNILQGIILLFEKYHKHKIFFDQYIKNDILENKNCEDIYKTNIVFDFVISIGGDGALLSAVRRMKSNQIPVLGIHIGNLGFLNRLTFENYINKLDNILSSEILMYDNRTILSACFNNAQDRQTTLYGLNEIFINRSDVSRLLTVEVFVDEELLNVYRCDGLIVSTALGSTAYSLSAGGPIVESTVNSHIITPVSPHSLSSRPIVVNDNCTITVKRHSNYDNVTVFADGQESEKVLKNYNITIHKSSVSAKFLKIPGEKSYYEKLRSNLGWNK